MKLPATEIQVEQGSDEWLAERLPLITGSRFKDVLSKNKGKSESSARRNYRAEMVVQRLTGQEVERYKSRAMQWGNDMEALAATSYSLITGNMTETCGLFKHNKYAIGVSPDRRIKGQKGCVEIKCYELANHIAALRSGHMPPEHKAQVQGEMWFTASDFCDFVSYAPELPPNAQMFIERIYRDDDYIAMLEQELLLFDTEVNEEVEFIKNYNGKRINDDTAKIVHDNGVNVLSV